MKRGLRALPLLLLLFLFDKDSDVDDAGAYAIDVFARGNVSASTE